MRRRGTYAKHGTRENVRAKRGNGTLSVGGGGAHKPLLSQTCAHCHTPFSAVDPFARFCSTRCRTAHWKDDKKQAALVKLLVVLYDMGERARRIVEAAVQKATARFYAFAEWLGFTYHTKKYEWRLTV